MHSTAQHSTAQHSTAQHSTLRILFILMSSILVFVYYPISGGFSKLLYGNERIIFTLLSIYLVYSFSVFDVYVPRTIHSPLLFLGEISYGLYLLHPIVYLFLSKLLPNTLPFYIIFLISSLSSICLSYLSFSKFETYFTKKYR